MCVCVRERFTLHYITLKNLQTWNAHSSEFDTWKIFRKKKNANARRRKKKRKRLTKKRAKYRVQSKEYRGYSLEFGLEFGSTWSICIPSSIDAHLIFIVKVSPFLFQFFCTLHIFIIHPFMGEGISMSPWANCEFLCQKDLAILHTLQTYRFIYVWLRLRLNSSLKTQDCRQKYGICILESGF